MSEKPVSILPAQKQCYLLFAAENSVELNKP